MRFINGEEAQPHGPQEVGVLRLVERFRGHIEELGLARGHSILDPHHFRFAQRAVEVMGDVRIVRMAADGVHLVLHQSDERAHHDGTSFLHQGRQLIAQRLAASGGHDDEHMLARHQTVDHLLLFALELVKTEKLGQTLLHGRADKGTGIHKGLDRRLHLTLASTI